MPNNISKLHIQVAVSHYFYRCVNDYCGTLAYYSNNNEERRKTQEVRDLEAVRCTTFAAYSKECANRQIILFWRTNSTCRK